MRVSKLIAPAIFISALTAAEPQLQVKNGDVIFQTTASSQSKAIQLATHSRYSHVGIVYFEKGRAMVLEAVQPVRVTPLKKFLARSVGGHYAVKRLKNADAVLTPAILKKMQSVGRNYIGKNYDWAFGWSDDRIYCSELVWKIYQQGAGIELAATKKLREFDLSHPAVKAKLKERYGSRVPLDEPVVAPSQLYESGLLENIFVNE
ncbi:YiiX family permuted papain-like enzyme [Turneriella parva]|uniref:Peptidoglycan peptidase n=1 Tax=Turneriella parva (strain ATCC BAA-1111 / DSM 21527 / NCTC 11395 / H) TaxID=869212 RepID=I4B5H5_TURPD|nr:YiiX family permuted papain-like enzyme [Turneriella parva]AFM12532.1 putative peptidoglycan peptidase [Turneriella parva DSM 21527]